MKASELSVEESLRREKVVDALRVAGWDCGKWEEMFAKGFSLTPEAYCEMSIDDRLIGIGYHPHVDDLTLRLESSSGEQVILHLYPSGAAEILAEELAAQVGELVRSDNSKHLLALIEELSSLCRRIELETSEGFVKIQ